MIEIPLSRGKIATIDDCDAHLAEYKWWYVENKGSSGYATRKFCLPVRGKMLAIRLHHAVMGQPINKFEIDHIDGNGLNNCRSNLRIVTRRENMSNCKIHRNGKKLSKYIGVTFNKITNKWVAQIQIRSRRIYIGSFNTEEEARDAYQNFLHKITNVMT
jgi:hypothetical protein